MSTATSRFQTVLLLVVLLGASFLSSNAAVQKDSWSLALPQHRQIEKVLDAIRRPGQFSTIEHVLYMLYGLPDGQEPLPLDQKVTLFVPSDKAIDDEQLSQTLTGWREIFHHHVAATRLTYQDLVNLSPGTRIETIQPEYSLVIANDDSTKGPVPSISGARVTHADLYTDDKIAVHGIDGVLYM